MQINVLLEDSSNATVEVDTSVLEEITDIRGRSFFAWVYGRKSSPKNVNLFVDVDSLKLVDE